MAPRLPLSLLFCKYCMSHRELCCKHCGQMHTEKWKLGHEVNRNSVRYKHCVYPIRSFFAQLSSKNISLSNKEETNIIKAEDM